MSEKIVKFEDLVAWQKARVLTRAIYQVTRKGEFAKDFGLRNQIQRAAVSIMSNIAEGFERYNPNEFHQFLSIAKASCAEVRSQLYVVLDAEYLDSEEFYSLMLLVKEIGKVIGGLRASVQRRRNS